MRQPSVSPASGGRAARAVPGLAARLAALGVALGVAGCALPTSRARLLSTPTQPLADVCVLPVQVPENMTIEASGDPAPRGGPAPEVERIARDAVATYRSQAQEALIAALNRAGIRSSACDGRKAPQGALVVQLAAARVERGPSGHRTRLSIHLRVRDLRSTAWLWEADHVTGEAAPGPGGPGPGDVESFAAQVAQQLADARLAHSR